jgi:Cu2+-exporting ATPase
MPAPAPQRTPLPAADEAWRQALARGVCVHCGGPLGRGWREEDGPFCCRGCRAVHDLIRGAGLERYYDLRRGERSPSALLHPDDFAWLDRQIAGEPQEAATLRLSLDVQGVHCAACVWLVEELFRREPAGLELRLNPSLGRLDLAWDPARGDLKRFLARVESFGYRFGVPRKQAAGNARGLLLRLAIAVAAALNVMMFSIAFYAGLAPADGALYRYFGWLSCALATLAVGVSGPVFFRGAWAGLRQRVAHLDLPISIGMLLAWVGSMAAYVRGGPRVAYFDTLAVFAALMLVGRWAQERVLERNRNALLAAAGVEGLTAKVRRAGRLAPLPADTVVVGDELWIAPGDLVPVDGIVLRRDAEVALDWITGESATRRCAPGETAPAGAFNAGLTGFALTATQDFGASRLHDLLRAAPAGDDGPRVRSRWWSRIGAVYVAAVLLLASVAGLIWLVRDPRRALEVTVAVLIVTCPCAIGLAAPLAQELTLHALRRRGIFVRRAGFFERALTVRQILLDKTGTLTLGRLALDDPSRRALRGLAVSERARLLEMVARSNHPVSRCLAAALAQLPVAVPGPVDDGPPVPVTGEELVERPGQGLTCRFAGREYRLGRAPFALGASRNSGSPNAAGDAAGDAAGVAANLADATARETVLSVDGAALASFRFTEDFRPDALAELQALAAAGYGLRLLSGDAPDRVRTAARLLGLPAEAAEGGLTPEAKAARVAALDRHDTLMVGDGLNDSPAFAAAWCTATPAVDRPVLPGKADFYFLGDGVAALRRSLGAARRLRVVTRDNFLFSALYNLAAVALCFAGVVTPLAAAVLMPLSSVTVVGVTTWRLSGRRLTWIS